MADALGTPPAAATPTVGVVSDEDHRLALAGLIAPQTSTLAVRTGVMWGPGSTAIITGTTATGTMTVNVAAFHAVTSRATADGVYWGPTNEASRTVNIAAAPGANSRIDVVYVKQNDTASPISVDTGTTQELYGVATGTAAVSPTKPSLSSITGAIELGTVTVAAGATNTLGAGVTIANTARQTVARGAPVPVLDTTDRATLTTFTGLHVIRLDLGGVLQRWVTGTTWVSYATATDIAKTTGTLTPAAGWAADAAYYTPSYHLSSDGVVTLRGRLLRTGANVTLGSAPAVLTLPAAIQPTSAIAPDTYVGIGGPPAQRYPAVLTCASPFTTMSVADTAVSAGTFNTSSGYVNLDGVSWYL